MEQHQVVTRDAWLAARIALLAKEKALTQARDALAAERLTLPWVKVTQPYVFEGPRGPETLADLFAGRSQLMVQHFMFGPGWKEGCTGCSFMADHVDAARQHLEPHDVSFAAVSRAPFAEFEPFRQRMGWHFHWVSSYGSDFNRDFGVYVPPEDQAKGRAHYNYADGDFEIDELPGVSVFHRDAAGGIFHTYSTYGRGCEELIGAYNFLDLMPKGRNEPAKGNMTEWMRHHDRYGSDAPSCCHG